MKITTLGSLCAAALLAFASQVNASTIAYDNFGGDDLNLTSFTGEESYTSGGDGFEEYDSGESAPFTLIDSSTGTFLTDSLGIIVEAPDGSYDPFFGAVDIVNGDNADGDGTAVWTFDTTGATDLVVSFDLAAMGDFESGEDITVTVLVDAVPVAVLSGSPDTDIDQDYTLADGDTFTLNDPMIFEGVALSNEFTTFTTGNLGDGDTVTIEFFVDSLDGGSEGIALDSIVVSSIPEPGSIVLVLLGSVIAGAVRMRRTLG